MGNKKNSSQTVSHKPLFHIAFQEGFHEDEVQVEHNGQRVYQKSKITSDVRIGLADSFETPQLDGPDVLYFIIPEKGIKQRITFEFSHTVYIAVSYVDQELQLSVSDQPFGYM